MKKFPILLFALLPVTLCAQVKWNKVDSLFVGLPPSVHIYNSIDSLDGKANIAYYVEADLKDKNLMFSTDTTLSRRLTPKQYFERNDQPLVVVNTTFFSFQTNQNLNVVIKDGKLVGYNIHSIAGRGKDTFTYRHTTAAAIGISKKRKADVAWIYSDSSYRYAIAFEKNPVFLHDSISHYSKYSFAPFLRHAPTMKKREGVDEKWKMQTAVGGGPVLIHEGQIRITNNEEWRFAGKAINDRHPRTAMGYTADNKLIILVVEGRNPGKAEGASLNHLASMLKDIGCIEALNLDGGGSSCMLVNGKETIYPSDKGVQRPVPAVFLINSKVKSQKSKVP